MELAPAVPAWLTWVAAGAAGLVAAAALVLGIEAFVDLDRG